METVLTIASVLVLLWGILEIILFFKIWGMTSDVADIKRLLQNRAEGRSVASQEDFASDSPVSISFKKGDIVESEKFGKLKYFGTWKGNHTFYPAAGQKLPQSKYTVTDSSEEYLSVPESDLGNII